jgi:hypothetical protein
MTQVEYLDFIEYYSHTEAKRVFIPIPFFCGSMTNLVQIFMINILIEHVLYIK